MIDAEIANYVVNLIKECLCNKKTALEETLCFMHPFRKTYFV